jgi:hypothetical protein
MIQRDKLQDLASLDAERCRELPRISLDSEILTPALSFELSRQSDNIIGEHGGRSARDIFARERLGGSEPFAVVRVEQGKATRHEGQADGRQPGNDLPRSAQASKEERNGVRRRTVVARMTPASGTALKSVDRPQMVARSPDAANQPAASAMLFPEPTVEGVASFHASAESAPVIRTNKNAPSSARLSRALLATALLAVANVKAKVEARMSRSTPFKFRHRRQDGATFRSRCATDCWVVAIAIFWLARSHLAING